MRYAEEVILVLSLLILAAVLHGWNAIRSFGSVVPSIAMAGLGLWAVGLMVWAILSLKHQYKLSKPAFATIIMICLALATLQ